jgi:hypothetical protein
MNITVTVPDDQAPRIINALCVRFGYKSMILSQDENGVLIEIPNPQTKSQFAKASIIKYLKELVGDVELEEAKRSIILSDIDLS